MKKTDLNAVMRTAFEYPEAHTEARLTVTQRGVIKTVIDNAKLDSATLAKLNGISIFNASNQLTSLYYRGYLQRKSTPDPTGGNMFSYTCDLNQWGR